jgi:hypothetical protein
MLSWLGQQDHHAENHKDQQYKDFSHKKLHVEPFCMLTTANPL